LLFGLFQGVEEVKSVIDGAQESTLKATKVFISLRTSDMECFRVNVLSSDGKRIPHWLGPFEFYHMTPFQRGIEASNAFLGLATRFGSSLGFAHLGGLWFEDIHRGLLWESQWTSGIREKHFCKNWSTAPSWSWLSANFLVMFRWHGQFYTSLTNWIHSPSYAEIIDAHISRSNKSYYREISLGQLSINISRLTTPDIADSPPSVVEFR
jgi:hypothetical protein